MQKELCRTRANIRNCGIRGKSSLDSGVDDIANVPTAAWSEGGLGATVWLVLLTERRARIVDRHCRPESVAHAHSDVVRGTRPGSFCRVLGHELSVDVMHEGQRMREGWQYEGS